MSVSSSSWGLGRAAVCDCGTPWTFLLLFLIALVNDNHVCNYLKEIFASVYYGSVVNNLYKIAEKILKERIFVTMSTLTQLKTAEMVNYLGQSS